MGGNRFGGEECSAATGEHRDFLGSPPFSKSEASKAREEGSASHSERAS